MSDNELLSLWKSGLSKYQVAKIYMRLYNQSVKMLRFDIKHRHEKFVTYYKALGKVEMLILTELKNNLN